jgi:hypothetical protein
VFQELLPFGIRVCHVVGSRLSTSDTGDASVLSSTGILLYASTCYSIQDYDGGIACRSGHITLRAACVVFFNLEAPRGVVLMQNHPLQILLATSHREPSKAGTSLS